VKGKLLIQLSILLPVLVLACFTISQVDSIQDDKETNNLRGLLGFPSLAIGNLSPAAREPGLELFCTGIYDTPGGYCNYYANGVYRDFINYVANITEGISK
jgi:hypothetical protein